MKKGQHTPFFLVVLALVVLVAIWSTLLLLMPKQPTLEQRVMDVGAQLKCVVCQGESVADSQAALAQQMRLVIREQLQAGRSEQDVLTYFEERYGSQIVWAPPWQGMGLLAWLVPILFWLGGVLLMFLLMREWQAGKSRRADAGKQEQRRQEHVDVELEPYRAQLEAELAAEDALFRQAGREAN